MPEVTISKSSTPEQARDWVSRCISTRQRESPEEGQDQSVAVCMEQARKAGAPVRRAE